MDEYLDSLGLYRKHVAKDGSCLFRVVSEQVFQTQHYHLMVRTACINYLEKNRSKYEEFIEGSFEQYLENLKNPKEWAGHVEINAMSILFKRDFLVYQEVGKPPVRVTNNDYPDFITSCYSHSNHYDCVYPKAFLGAAAICQSLVYEVLYKRVFKLGDEVDIAVKKMLHDKIYSKQRKNSFLCRDSHRESTSSKEDSSEGVEEEQDASAEIRKALAQGVPPFPYKVAKALDPEIYRNVEFDLWNESRKEQLRFEQMIIPDFAPGVKCLVRIEKDQTEPYHAHIQEMSQNQGPVIVYIEELGQKCAVPYENLEALPIPAYKVFPWQGSGNKSYRMLSEYLRSSLQGKLKGRSKQPKKPSSKDMSLVIPFPTGLSPPSIQFTTAQTFPIQGSPSKPFPIPSVSSYHMQPDEGAVLTHSQIASGKFPEGHVPVVCLPNVQMAGSPSELSSVTSLWGCGSSYGKVPAPMKMAEHYAESKDQCEKNDSFTSEILLEHDSKTNCFSCCTSLGQDINRYLDESDTNSSCSPVFSNSPNHPVTLLQSSEETVPHAVSPSSHPLHSSISAVNQPVTVYPCPVYSGMLLPYGESVSVNLNAWRSQDPTGSDLPLADLPTVRFFYNLGCDYFRMTSMIPVASPSPYSTWTACNGGVSYAVGTPCSSVPITGSDDQRAVGTSGTYINTGSQLYPAQPVMVGSPPPSISAHAVFYPSALQTSVHHPSPAPSSHVSPCVTSLP